MLSAINGGLRRQRQRLTMVAVVLGLAGVVVAAHSAMGEGHMGDSHMGDALVMCLAVAETAVMAFGAAIALGALIRRPSWLMEAMPVPSLAYHPAPRTVPARAGPTRLQVFRL
jgi:hypothetical protein